MSNENKPLEKEEIVNGDESTLNTQPETETESENLSEESDTNNATDDSEDGGDTGGSNPPPEKERG